MILVVGLGNPGASYKNTRHNVGFIAINIICNRYNLTWSHKSKFNADIATGDCELGKIILCKPDTFMNLSGAAVQPLTSFYKIPLANIIIIYDDVDLPFGKIKYKVGGSTGGHNGLKSLDSLIGTDYHRLRIGIGRPRHIDHDVSSHVLGKFTAYEEQLLKERLNFLVDKLKLLAEKDFEKFKAAISS